MTKKDPNAVALGKKGGVARNAKMTAEQRSEAARKAVNARWARHRARKLESDQSLQS